MCPFSVYTVEISRFDATEIARNQKWKVNFRLVVALISKKVTKSNKNQLNLTFNNNLFIYKLPVIMNVLSRTSMRGGNLCEHNFYNFAAIMIPTVNLLKYDFIHFFIYFIIFSTHLLIIPYVFF